MLTKWPNRQSAVPTPPRRAPDAVPVSRGSLSFNRRRSASLARSARRRPRLRGGPVGSRPIRRVHDPFAFSPLSDFPDLPWFGGLAAEACSPRGWASVDWLCGRWSVLDWPGVEPAGQDPEATPTRKRARSAHACQARGYRAPVGSSAGMSLGAGDQRIRGA